MQTLTAWLIALGGTAAVTWIGHELHPHPSTVGFAFLVVVLFSSLRGGLLPGTIASIAATLCFNFFFFEPLYTLRLAEPTNWVTLGAFLVTSVIVSRLVIAARVQAEEKAHLRALRESEMLKTAILRAVSHDLTTPLTAITIHTEALRRRATQDGELQSAVAGIVGETSRLRRRIDNLLSMARLEAGNATPNREPSPPADLFRAVRENLPLVFESRPVIVHVDDDCPDADVDPSLTLEILVNLIENAHRVSPPNAPIELHAQRHGSSSVRIEVRDRGPGFAGDTNGGLGLQIARSFAAAHGGAIELTPREGGGTIVRVDLPAAPLPAEGERR